MRFDAIDLAGQALFSIRDVAYYGSDWHPTVHFRFLDSLGQLSLKPGENLDRVLHRGEPGIWAA